MVIKLGMVFADNNVPDFGNIETGVDGALTLLDADKSKLNSLLSHAQGLLHILQTAISLSEAVPVP